MADGSKPGPATGPQNGRPDGVSSRVSGSTGPKGYVAVRHVDVTRVFRNGHPAL